MLMPTRKFAMKRKLTAFDLNLFVICLFYPIELSVLQLMMTYAVHWIVIKEKRSMDDV